MKKHWKSLLLTSVLVLTACFTCCAAEPIPIEFHKAGGGQFIYCNNPENINYWNLSTKENPYCTYMMKNEDLQPDRYSVFFCFYNCAEFDVEPDIEFKGNDATITIHSVGYYLPQGKEFWDCLGTWSDFLNINIRTLNGFKQYVPFEPAQTEFPKTIRLSEAGEWLSKYIYNYDVVKPRTTFNMLVDFTIDEGTADVNFAALKHYDITGDRSNHNPDAAPGNYHRDTSVKGIEKESLPMVEADLNIVIDSETKNGEPISAKVFNQFHNEGNVVPHWMTNINPARDSYEFSKNVAAGSDMLELTYKDDSKLSFYGKNVPMVQRNNIWNFDIYHHDTLGYEPGMPGKADDHIPNAETGKTLDLDPLPNVNWEFNLGNFGVTTRYHLSITNNDSVDRVLNYMLETVLASNIVIILDDAENMLNPYSLKSENAFALSKGITFQKKEDCMASFPVAPGETKKYILDVIEPTNCYGGILHSLKVDSYPYLKEEKSVFPQYTEQYPLKNIFYNGQEFMKWENGDLFRYTKDKNWEKSSFILTNNDLLYNFNQNDQVIPTKQGYAVRFSAWDEYEKDYISIRDQKKTVYFYDNENKMIEKSELPGYIEKITYAEPYIYAMVNDKVYSTENSTTGMNELKLTNSRFPLSNGKIALTQDKNGIYHKQPYGKEAKISYEVTQPQNIQQAGDIFYYIKSWKASYHAPEQNVVSLSADGINWTDYTLPNQFYELKQVFHFDGKIYIDCKYEQFCFEDDTIAFDPVNVMLNNEMLSFLTPAETQNDRTMVPMRFFFEKLGAKVTWINATQQIYVEQNGKTILFQVENDMAYVNDEEKKLDAPPYLKDNKTMIPLRFLSESLGYQVGWEEETKTASISSN